VRFAHAYFVRRSFPTLEHMQEHIRANAELVRKVAREQLGAEVGYDEAGVRWLDAYIDGQRRAASEEVKSKLPNTLGSYLGECILQTYGGRWVKFPEGWWGVEVNEKLTAFPFNKVQKQLENEDGDSVLGFFTAIPAIIASNLGTKQEAPAKTSPSRPWWKFW
jgi:hypothetical protein